MILHTIAYCILEFPKKRYVINLDMKMILDFVLNHTSDQHEWFKMSVLRKEPYTDYFVWKSPKEFDADGVPVCPNNWVCFVSRKWSFN